MQTENVIDIFEDSIDSSADRQVGRVMGKVLVGRLNASAVWFAQATIKRIDPVVAEGDVPTNEALNEVLAEEEAHHAREVALADAGLIPAEHPQVTMEKQVRLRNYIQARLEEHAKPFAFGIPSPYDVGMSFERTYDFQTALTASNVQGLGFEIPEHAKQLISTMRIRNDPKRAQAMKLMAEQLAPTIGLPVDIIMTRMGEGYLKQLADRVADKERVLAELASVTGGIDNVSATQLFDSFPAVRQYRMWVRVIEGMLKERLRLADMLLLGKLPLTHEAIGDIPLILAGAKRLREALIARTNDDSFRREMTDSIERGANVPDMPAIVEVVVKAA